jgi:hypothetical protein
MAETNRKNWRQLCNAALEAKDPDELLKIVQDLNQALKREEQVRRDFREARMADRSSEEVTDSAPHRITPSVDDKPGSVGSSA